MNGINSVIVLFLIFSVGFLLTRRNVWPENSTSVLSVIVVKIAAPSLAILSIYDRFNRELLAAASFHLMILCLYTFILFLIGKGSSRLLGLKNGRAAVFEVSFTFSNTIFIGLPVNQIAFGNEGLPYLFTFYLVTLTGFWSVGAYRLAHSSDSAERFSPKKIFSPGFIGIIIGSLLVLVEGAIPFALDSALRYIGGLTVPLSLLVIGANLTQLDRNVLRVKKDEVLILVGKFILSPLIMLALLKLFNVQGMAFSVFMLTAAMPCHMQTSIVAEHNGVEGSYAARLVSLSTLVSLITIPLTIYILTH